MKMRPMVRATYFWKHSDNNSIKFCEFRHTLLLDRISLVDLQRFICITRYQKNELCRFRVLMLQKTQLSRGTAIIRSNARRAPTITSSSSVIS